MSPNHLYDGGTHLLGLKWYRKIVGLVPKPPDLAYISLAHSTTLLITIEPPDGQSGSNPVHRALN